MLSETNTTIVLTLYHLVIKLGFIWFFVKLTGGIIVSVFDSTVVDLLFE